MSDWQITSKDGSIIDPEFDPIRWNDDGMTFTATRWALHEGSLVSVPADPLSGIRSLGTGLDRATSFSSRANHVLVRMQARQRMYERGQAALIGSSDE